MYNLRSSALALVLASPAFADCPTAPDHSGGVKDLLDSVQQAQTERDARQISGKLWELWTDAPDEIAQAMLDRAMLKRQSHDFFGALHDLNKLVAYCPDFAEGYNQRAFVYFLTRDFASALVDLDRAIALSPNHVAAISGRALTLMGLGRTDEARTALEQALALNPWIPERGLVGPGGPLAPKGEDI